MMTIRSWRKVLQPFPALQILRKSAAGDDAIAASLPRGDGKVLLNVGEKADRGYIACLVVGSHALQERERLEAGGVEVEDEEVGRGLPEGIEELLRASWKRRLDADLGGGFGDLALEQKVFYGPEDSSRQVGLRAVVW